MPRSSKSGSSGNESYWTDGDSQKLYDHFARGDFDPNQQKSPYIKALFDKTDWLQARTTPKKLYRNYRRHANIWLAEHGKKGARSK